MSQTIKEIHDDLQQGNAQVAAMQQQLMVLQRELHKLGKQQEDIVKYMQGPSQDPVYVSMKKKPAARATAEQRGSTASPKQSKTVRARSALTARMRPRESKAPSSRPRDAK